MQDLPTVVSKVAAWTDVDASGVRWRTCTHDLSLPLAFRSRELQSGGFEADADALELIGLALAGVRQEIQGILVSWHRLDWSDKMHKQGVLDDPTFMLYAASDIDLFHVRLRSAFDYLAIVAWGTASRRGTVARSDKFSALVDWLEKNPTRRKDLGVASELLLDHAAWFRDLRDLRDTVIHRRGITLVFPGAGIGFMLLQPGGGYRVPQTIAPAIVKAGDNVIDFRRYACAHLCWFLNLAEEVSELLRERWTLTRMPGTRSAGGGVEMLRAWVASLGAALSPKSSEGNGEDAPSERTPR